MIDKEEQRTVISILYRMINIPSNFVSKEKNFTKCIENEKEDMEHLCKCNYLNREKTEEEFEKKSNGTIRE